MTVFNGEHSGSHNFGSPLEPRQKPGVLGLLSFSYLQKNLNAIHYLKNDHNALGMSVLEEGLTSL